MLKLNSKSYNEIRAYLEIVPVIETHEHFIGVVEPIGDILDFILGNYYKNDIVSCSFGMEKEAISLTESKSYPKEEAMSFEERFDIFKKLYSRSDKTAYARGLQIGLKKCWGIEKINDLDALKELEKKFAFRNQEFYCKTMDECGIKAKVVDIFDIRPYVLNSAPKFCKMPL